MRWAKLTAEVISFRTMCVSAIYLELSELKQQICTCHLAYCDNDVVSY